MKPPGFEPGQVRGGLQVILTAEHYIHSATRAARNTARSVELDSRYKHVYSKDKTEHIFFEIPTAMTGGERRVVVEI